MKERELFVTKIWEVLSEIDENILTYDENEFWMIERLYQYVEFYAYENRLLNTCVALPLVRGLFDGKHRKASVLKDGERFRLPYMIHCLAVCRMLVDLGMPFSKDEEDIVLASALCHDVIEDIEFSRSGVEMYEELGLDRRVYDTVKLVSKRKDFTLEEERAHFDAIMKDPFALLVKLSDRGNNVEDLYNMSVWKVHEYVGETRNLILPMCDYAKEHFPALIPCIDILEEKMISLTELAEILVDRFEDRKAELLAEVALLEEENKRLRMQMGNLEG